MRSRRPRMAQLDWCLAAAVAVAFATGCKVGGDAAAGQGGDAPKHSGPSADFCRGRVTDKDSRPLTPLPRPDIGKWVAEPDFGTRITRVSAAAKDQEITPVYSTVPAWNADGSLLLLYRWGHGHELYDGKTLAHVGELDCHRSDGLSPSPSDVEHVMWDPADPAGLYYPSLYAADGRGPLPILYRCNVRTHLAKIVHDFSTAPTNCAPGKDELSMGSDPQWFPGDLVGLQCGRTVKDKWVGRKWIYDLRHDRVYTPRTGEPFTDNVAPIAAPSGTLAYYRGRVFDLDLAPVRTLQITDAYEHANVGRSAAGHDIYYASDFDGSDPAAINAHDLQTGARIHLLTKGLGWGYPPTGIHLSSAVADKRAAGWVLVSMVGAIHTTKRLTMELVLANVDTREVCRIGRHRSYGKEGPSGYHAEPHPAWHVLADGTLEGVFASDWGGGDRVDSYLIRVGP
jgi:hypothetical protein